MTIVKLKRDSNQLIRLVRNRTAKRPVSRYNVFRLRVLKIENMNEPIDLSAFPILRIDQISFVDSNDLENSLKEVKVLLQAGENDNPAMYRYLVKQYDLMKREMESRRALSRVENLLRGLEDPLNRKIDSSTIISPRIPDNIHDVPKATKQEESQHISNKTAESIVINSVTNKSGVDSNLMMDNDGAKLDVETRHETPTKVQPAIESITLPLQRDGLPSATKIHSGVEHLTPRSTHSSHSNRSSRRSQHNDPDNNPSKKSIEVVYKNFGNEFIVAATEKKKRFYPAKKPTESIEEIKNRERNERYFPSTPSLLPFTEICNTDESRLCSASCKGKSKGSFRCRFFNFSRLSTLFSLTINVV